MAHPWWCFRVASAVIGIWYEPCSDNYRYCAQLFKQAQSHFPTYCSIRSGEDVRQVTGNAVFVLGLIKAFHCLVWVGDSTSVTRYHWDSCSFPHRLFHHVCTVRMVCHVSHVASNTLEKQTAASFIFFVLQNAASALEQMMPRYV